jgi:hypothetical protein
MSHAAATVVEQEVGRADRPVGDSFIFFEELKPEFNIRYGRVTIWRLQRAGNSRPRASCRKVAAWPGCDPNWSRGSRVVHARSKCVNRIAPKAVVVDVGAVAVGDAADPILLRTRTVMRMFEAAGLPCSRSTLDRMRRDGVLRAVELSRRSEVGFNASDVEIYIARHAAKSTTLF